MKKIILLAFTYLAANIAVAEVNKEEMVSNADVKVATSSTNIVVYPNTAINGGHFNIDFTADYYNEVIVVVQDILGNEFYSKLVIMYQQNLKVAVDMENRIPSGVYRVVACSDNDMYNKSIVVE